MAPRNACEEGKSIVSGRSASASCTFCMSDTDSGSRKKWDSTTSSSGSIKRYRYLAVCHCPKIKTSPTSFPIPLYLHYRETLRETKKKQTICVSIRVQKYEDACNPTRNMYHNVHGLHLCGLSYLRK